MNSNQRELNFSTCTKLVFEIKFIEQLKINSVVALLYKNDKASGVFKKRSASFLMRFPVKCSHLGSNQGPSDYESDALTG